MGLLRPTSMRFARAAATGAAGDRSAHAHVAQTRPAAAARSEAPPEPQRGRLALRGLARDESGREEGRHEEPIGQAVASAVPAQQPADGLIEIAGKITHEIYSSGDYSVYALKTATGDVKVAVTSTIKASKGDKVVVKGGWTTYKGKPTFKAVMLMHAVAKGARGVVTWLGTRAASGVGKATADKLAKHFGDRLPEVIADAGILVEAGIPMAKAQSIADAWNNNAGQPELIEFLGRFGIGEMTIAKIVRRYGGAARKVIRENPWWLAETIDGVGFRTADEIAFEAGHARDSVARIKSGLSYTLAQKTQREGHCGLPSDVLVDEAARLLELHRKLVAAQLEAVVDGQSVVRDEVTGYVCPASMLRFESTLAERLARLMEDGDRIDPETARSAIEKAMETLGTKRDESQIQAGMMALMNPVSIITGGPGTGKSTIQRAIVLALEEMKRSVVLASPTGRAAKRLAEVSGRPASTCHRLLMFSAEKGGFEYDASNNFEEDRFIIDEFSMVDVWLGMSFLDAVKSTGGVTMVGDVDQLPSVGAGQVLRDLIESGTIPVARLSTVHRQAGDSGIVVAAARINRGEHPIDGDELKGFEFEEIYDPDDIGGRIVTLMKDTLPGMGYDPIRDVQVLAAMRKGDVGIQRLNEIIKSALNPATEGRSVEIRKRVFSVGDRVMHLRNDYSKKVYNGEVGTVLWAGTRKSDEGKDEPSFKVDYSGYEAFYGPKDVEDVELAWAATVHKSQGCEFPVVIFACPLEHRRMLTRNLVYTAVTRSKQMCIMLGNDRALRNALATADVNRRYTGLSRRMAMSLSDRTDDGPIPAP